MRVHLQLAICALILVPTFAAAQPSGPGAISGTITNASTSLPVPSVTVYAWDTAGNFVTPAATDASGVYTLADLAPGSYLLSTFTPAGLINEVYNNIQCIGNCTNEVILTGTPVTVAIGATTTGIDFALSPGGTIRGTVTDASTLAPLAGVSVRILNSTGTTLTTATTNAMGQYVTTLGLASGSYLAYTSNSLAYFNKVFDNIDCGVGCSSAEAVAGGTPIAVTAGAMTSNVNFALVKGALVTGTITDGRSGAALANVSVYIVTPSGSLVTTGTSDGVGFYRSGALTAGTYYAYTVNVDGYIDQVFGGGPCAGQCVAISGGTPITVGAGELASGRNFALAQGGRISGTVSGADGTPLQSVVVYFYTPTGAPAGNTFTDASGGYTSGSGFPVGTYYAFTSSDDDYIDEIFDDRPCPGDCAGSEAVATGTPIAVAIGATTGGRNFTLERGGRITGRVTNAATSAGASGIIVYAIGVSGGSGAGVTNTQGDYTVIGLSPGQYVLYTAATTLVNEIHNDISCGLGCRTEDALANGAKVTVTLGSTVTGIDFALSPGGTLSGVVTSTATGTPIANVQVVVMTSTISTITTRSPVAVTNTSGAFTVAGLPAGSYYAYTANTQGFINETHGGLPCAGMCLTPQATLSSPIVVTVGATTSGINFTLDPGGRIAGRVTSAATGAPLPFAQIGVADSTGRVVSYSNDTGADGVYLTRDGLPPGTYFAFADYTSGHVGKVFDNIGCPGPCTTMDIPAAGAPIAVTGATTVTGKDFALALAGGIGGITTDAASGLLLSSGPWVYDDSGRLITPATSGAVEWSATELPPGSYRLLTREVGHLNEIYDNVPCPNGCSPSRTAAGTPIVVTAGAFAGGHAIALTPRSGVPGPPLNLAARTATGGTQIEWSAPATGGVATSYRLEAGLSPGTTAVSFTSTTTQFLAAGAPPGVHYLRVKGINDAGTGPASTEFVLVLGAGGVLPGATALSAAMVGSRLILTWSDSFGGAPTQYLVEAGTASGVANIATLPASTRAFTYDPVPPGFYFLRVRARNATGNSAPSNEVMIVAGGAAAPPRAPHRVGATVTGSTVGLIWNAAPGATSYVIEAGSATGLSNLAVVTVGAVTTISFPGIPAGTYYVRIRAVNARGRSVASEEVVVVVG